MTDQFSDAIRTTFRPAKYASGATISAADLEDLAAYVTRPGTGEFPSDTFSELVSRKMGMNPPLQDKGVMYVAYGGKDRHGDANWDNAKEFVENSHGRAGLIGDTRWGKFVLSSSGDPAIAKATAKLDRYIAEKGISPAYGNTSTAVEDSLWNYGSSPYMKNAIESKLPIIAFVDGAPANRGYTSHELPTLQKSPQSIINGYLVRDITGDAATFTGDAAARYQVLQKRALASASQHSHRTISASEFGKSVDLPIGYDAKAGTLFGIPEETFLAKNLPDMSAAAEAWSKANATELSGLGYLPPSERMRLTPITPSSTESIASIERSAMPRAGNIASRSLAYAGAAAVAYDAGQTAANVDHLYRASNAVGSQSEIIHFGSRNISMLAGAELGAATGAALGVESGPGLLVTGAIGGVVGAIGGEKIASKIDDYRTYNQQDQTGQSWHMDPAQPDRGWIRTETRLDPNGPTVPGYGFSAPAYKTETITAPPETANELNYKASGVQVQMALAHPPAPRSPYSVEANQTDALSLREANWQRDPNTHAWRREVTTGYMEHGLPMTRTDVASPERTRELERSSAQIAEENRTNRPDAIAQRYLDAHRDYGWGRFGNPEPAALEAAKAPKNVLQASDGNEYKRGPDGSWKHEGWFGRETQATGNLRDELNEATRSNAIQAPAQKQAEPSNPTQDRIKEMLEAARNGDWEKFRQETQTFAQMQPGQQLQQNAVQQANHVEQQAEQQRAAQAQQQQNDQQQQQAQQQSHGPRMVR